ncbi:bifunctional 5,10-methylenetetrahydrofolate dehydrogenase/5,10-methenyltetrahydrofolate cyclohydrolase [Candidatus Saccharibacteria bacterium]|nr:bifunctional 5,10-methylenetetrahydrofolate dehydrogenase/5,10-methenyltetrahydrofolate cyclohydrolase [Candidatus Saccharibacteria bacterium]
MKILNGSELAGFVKERQANLVAEMDKKPKLVIVRDSYNPVIVKYVELKKRYGEDIGVVVEDCLADGEDDLREKILVANKDATVSGIIVQLPLKDGVDTDKILGLITPEKDVDGLSGEGKFDSATATAINWLLAGYDISLADKKIALVGRGRLVGKPLYKIWNNSGYDVTIFHRGDNLEDLRNFDVVVTATGAPHLIKNEMIRPGTVVVDAGTASEDGVLVGDIEEAVREREDLAAITPKIGGVGPLTVGVLFENVIAAN